MMLELLDQLNLDEDTSFKLFSAIRRADKEREETDKEQRELLKSLKEEVDKNPADPKAIEELLKKLKTFPARHLELQRKHEEEVASILTIENQARYVLFRNHFRKRMDHMIEEAQRFGPPPRGIEEDEEAGDERVRKFRMKKQMIEEKANPDHNDDE